MADRRFCSLNRTAIASCGAVVALCLLASCHPPTGSAKPRVLGGLVIKSDPADALIYVDDRYQGSVAALGNKPLPLLEGFHRVEIRKDGYFSHFTEVTVVKGVRQQLEVTLRKEPF